MKKELVVIDSKEFGLEENTANNIRAAYQPMLDKAVEIEDEYNKIIKVDVTDKNTSTFKELRLKIVKIRTGAVAIHKKEKQKYLDGGRFVDQWKNTFLLGLGDKETNLKEKEEHFVNIEKDRIAKLQNSRANELIQYKVEGDSEYIPDNLGTMPDNVWTNYISGAKLNFDNAEAAKGEENKKLIAQDEAEAEERERVNAENKKLNDEKLKREKEDAKKAEDDRIEAEKIAEAEMLEFQRIENLQNTRADELRKYKAENIPDGLGLGSMEDGTWSVYLSDVKTAHKDKVAAEKKAEDDRIKKERVDKELEDEREKARLKEKAEDEAAQKKLDDDEASKQAELNKGDAEKVQDLIKALSIITTSFQFESKTNQGMYKIVDTKIKEIIKVILS